MPFVPNDGGKAPKGAHLGLLMNDSTFTGIPVGATLAVITDPTRQDGIMPMILTKVTLKALHFRCACRRVGCTRKMIYRLSAEGLHPKMQTVG